MSPNRFQKTTAGILILATLLLTSPALVLAAPTLNNPPAPQATDRSTDPPVPGPTGTIEPPQTTPPSNTGGQSGGSTTINNSTAPGTGNNNSSGSDGSYSCGLRKFSVSQFFWNLLPNNAITTFFQESVCVSIILSGLVVGNLACWIISTFIQPVFVSTDPSKPACKPDDDLVPVAPATPPATPVPTPSATSLPATTPPPGAPVTVTPIAGLSSTKNQGLI